jgi:ATP-binding cassette subfamily B protein
MRRRVPDVRQLEAADCGAACLAMVLAYFGKRVPLHEVRELTCTDAQGVNALSLVKAARAYGLDARGLRAEVESLPQLPRGSVLHWEFSHFVVLERVTRKGVRVIDPACGRRHLPFDAVRRRYTGVAIAFDRSDGFDPTSSPARGTWRYLRPVLGHRRDLGRVLTASLLMRLLALALPLLTALVVDELVPRGDRHLLAILTVGAAGIVGYQFLTAFLRGNLLLELRTRLDMGLTTRFVEHLVELPYAYFLRRSSGDLMMRMQSNANVREILTTGSISALIDGAFATLYLALVAVVSLPLALLVLVIAALQVTTMLASWRRNQRLMSESLQVEATTQSYAYELLAGIQTLKASGAEHRAAEHWSGLFTDQVKVALTRDRLTAAVDSVMSALQTAAPLLILLAGAYQVIGGAMSLGTMLAAAALAAGFLQPLATLVSTGLQLQLVGSYMERINDVLDAPTEAHGRRHRPVARLAGHVRADSVSFAYGPLAPLAVTDVSLEVRPGQHVGIVGRSGSGKSTLAHLLLGLYPPTSGEIEFDGMNLRDLDVVSLRRQLGIVTQRPYLFASSIRQNIALTDPSLPLDAIVHAAKLACIHDDIEAMPMGYDTRLHDGGTSLSGGQRQRMAIARALVHRPSILLLDEATSELDTVTEQMVYERLAALSATTIVIAHRLSTVRHADHIVVLDDGMVAESGTHGDLVAKGGVYHALLNAQSSLGRESAQAVAELEAMATARALSAPRESSAPTSVVPETPSPAPETVGGKDFITRLRDEIQERMETLRPTVDEYARLQATRDVMQNGRSPSAAGTRRKRPT